MHVVYHKIHIHTLGLVLVLSNVSCLYVVVAHSDQHSPLYSAYIGVSSRLSSCSILFVSLFLVAGLDILGKKYINFMGVGHP